MLRIGSKKMCLNQFQKNQRRFLIVNYNWIVNGSTRDCAVASKTTSIKKVSIGGYSSAIKFFSTTNDDLLTVKNLKHSFVVDQPSSTTLADKSLSSIPSLDELLISFSDLRPEEFVLKHRSIAKVISQSQHLSEEQQQNFADIVIRALPQLTPRDFSELVRNMSRKVFKFRGVKSALVQALPQCFPLMTPPDFYNTMEGIHMHNLELAPEHRDMITDTFTRLLGGLPSNDNLSYLSILLMG